MRIYANRGNMLKVLAAIAVVLLVAVVVWACGIRGQSPGETDTPVPTVASDPTADHEQAGRKTSDPTDTALLLESQVLYRAIWADTIDEVRILVAAGADVNAAGGDGEPLLYTAVWRSEPEKVQILVDAGANVDAKDTGNNPLLYTAIWRDKTEALRILVDAGADVNALDANGDPLLHEAVWREHAEVAQILIVAGADVNARMPMATPSCTRPSGGDILQSEVC